MKHIRKYSVFLGIFLMSMGVVGMAGVSISEIDWKADLRTPVARSAGDRIQVQSALTAPAWMTAALGAADGATASHHFGVAAADLNADGYPEILVTRGVPLNDVYIPHQELMIVRQRGEVWQLERTGQICEPERLGPRNDMTGEWTILCSDPIGEMHIVGGHAEQLAANTATVSAQG